MSVNLFGIGRGHLSGEAADAAEEAGAKLVNYTDPGCACGWGCGGDDCPANQRHWFEGPNLGDPFDAALAESVMVAVCAVATPDDLDLLDPEGL